MKTIIFDIFEAAGQRPAYGTAADMAKVFVPGRWMAKPQRPGIGINKRASMCLPGNCRLGLLIEMVNCSVNQVKAQRVARPFFALAAPLGQPAPNGLATHCATFM